MRWTFALLLAAATCLPTSSARGKVCYECKNKRPAPYICAKKDTFKARDNARAKGCDIVSYRNLCQCKVWVAHQSTAPISPFVRRVIQRWAH